MSEIAGPPRGTTPLEELELLEEEELWTGDSGSDHSGWCCVATNPFPCPAPGCTFVAEFMTAAHLILVWQERGDPNLLRHAQRAEGVGPHPRAAPYKSSFVPTASSSLGEASGRPVHGVKRP